MATATVSPDSIQLFYSYSHVDEPLCKELQKHLIGLKRSGLIQDWYDRKIEPGSKWAEEIQKALERSSLILLLVSPDFLASEYIFSVELPFALERHQAGRAVVIPVLLRPVEWRDLPFAKLQVLPTYAKPVTLWPNQDEAFSDVAGNLRELLYRRRLESVKSVAPPSPLAPFTKERVLDAAVAASVVKDEPTDVVLMIRNSASAGLKAILRIGGRYSALVDDVQSKSLEIDFPRSPSGEALPATIGFLLESPAVCPPRQSKKIRVPAEGDSDVSVFIITPIKLGAVRLNLQVLANDVEVGSSVLQTSCVPPAVAESNAIYDVRSLPLVRSTGDFTQRFSPPAPKPTDSTDPYGPGEFTQFFGRTEPPSTESKDRPSFSVPPVPQSPAPSKDENPGEFTRMFGRDHMMGRDQARRIRRSPGLPPAARQEGDHIDEGISPVPPPSAVSHDKNLGEFTQMFGTVPTPLPPPPPAPRHHEENDLDEVVKPSPRGGSPENMTPPPAVQGPARRQRTRLIPFLGALLLLAVILTAVVITMQLR
jgi:hypothetical protein